MGHAPGAARKNKSFPRRPRGRSSRNNSASVFETRRMHQTSCPLSIATRKLHLVFCVFFLPATNLLSVSVVESTCRSLKKKKPKKSNNLDNNFPPSRLV